MMNALEYLERNMDGDIDVNEAAGSACMSSFHFQRMFHMLTGVTVADYVRRRRLTLAAQELASTTARVGDVAIKYGYESPEAFSKAFSKAHGIAPSASKRPGVRLKAFPRLSFHISIRGDQDMEYTIAERAAFTVVGRAVRVSCKDGENLKTIPAFWGQVSTDGTIEALKTLSKGAKITGLSILGICTEFSGDMQEFTYLVAVETTDRIAPDGFVVKEIGAATWAAFDSVGPMPGAIQSVWQRIFSEFFPSTGFEHAPGLPELEVYGQGNPYDEDYHCQVWVPIVRK